MALLPLTDDNVRWLYVTIWNYGWKHPHNYERAEHAWNVISEVLGIQQIKDNGRGQIIWKKGSVPADAEAH